MYVAKYLLYTYILFCLVLIFIVFIETCYIIILKRRGSISPIVKGTGDIGFKTGDNK